MTNEQQERHKRFDEKAEYFYFVDKFNDIDVFKKEFKSFLDEEVALAVANREKEIQFNITSYFAKINYINELPRKQLVEDIINLISKNK